jgi:hypothetical protein
MVSDPIMGAYARPNCVAQMKAAEGPWVEDRWNECGNRSVNSCRVKVPGATRVVTIGSSTSWGDFVPFENTWFARTGAILGARCGHPIDVQSFGVIANVNQNARRLNEILALQPDAVVMVLSAFDLAEIPTAALDPNAIQGNRPVVPQVSAALSLASLRELVSSSRALMIAQHFLFQDSDLYVAGYLRSADKADYLRPPFSPAWRSRLAVLEQAVEYFGAKLAAADVPFVLILVPQQAQAELISGRNWPPGVDPYAIGGALEEIANRHGVVFEDASRSFAQVKRAQDMFYTVNGHLNSAGHAVLASVAIRGLARAKLTAATAQCADPVASGVW